MCLHQTRKKHGPFLCGISLVNTKQIKTEFSCLKAFQQSDKNSLSFFFFFAELGAIKLDAITGAEHFVHTHNYKNPILEISNILGFVPDTDY